MVKYMLVSSIYAVHEQVIHHPRPIKVFDSIVDARAYAYRNVPKKGWFIVAEKGRPNDRFKVDAGHIWRAKNGVVFMPILRYGDGGVVSYVNKDGTLGRKV